MAYSPPPHRPYLIWPLDAWRLGVAGILFLFLFAWWQGWLPLPPPGPVTPTPTPILAVTTPGPTPVPAQVSPTGPGPSPSPGELAAQITATPQPTAPTPTGMASPTAMPTPTPTTPGVTPPPPTLAVLGDGQPWLPIRNPLLYGRTEPFGRVAVVLKQVPPRIYTVQADEFGRWQLALPDPLPVGATWVQVYLADAQNRPRSATVEQVLVVPPGAPIVDPPTITPLPLDGPLRTSTPVLSGSGPTGFSIRLELATPPGSDPTPLATVPVDLMGRWAYLVETPLPPGTYELWAVVVDETGRPLTRSAPWRFTIAPDARPLRPPQVTPQVAAPPTPAPRGVPGQAPEIVGAVGTAAPHARLFVFVDGRQVGETRATAEGNWSFAFSPPVPGSGHEIRVVEVDEEGRPLAISAPPLLPITGGSQP